MLSWPDFAYKQIIIHRVMHRGESLRFRADNIVILDDDNSVLLQHTCHRLFALFIVGEISITSVMLKNCIKHNFPIILLNNNLKVVTRINCAADGNTLLRIKQYNCCNKLQIAKSLIRQKIDNQIELIKSLRRLSREDEEAIVALREIDLDRIFDIKGLMGAEGNASKLFFKAYFRPLDWKRREPRCKRDIYNLLLDIGYTMLFQFVESMLCLYGFDLYCGVLHTLFYQRKSLVCDMVEPFRCIIDKRLRKAYNLGQIDEGDFRFNNGAYLLEWKNQSKYVKLFLKDILERKEEIFKFCQQYYRWVMRDGKGISFPTFKI